MPLKNEVISNQTFDEERALYNLTDSTVENCVFAGPADGESVLKESRNIIVKGCAFSLRYPLWHVKTFTLETSKFDDKSRAALWYCNNGIIKKSELFGVKAVRECENIEIYNSMIISPEFGWKSNNIKLENTSVTAEYLFLDSKNIKLRNVEMHGKYSFQYVENLEIDDSNLDTKDAFWHSKNVTVRNSVIKGEYLAWFSDGLTLINCTIIGTQPLCYCKNLKLINCVMEKCDLSFEYSDVEATVHSHVDSIKNPRSGTIYVESVGEIIMEDAVMECNGVVKLLK